MGGAAIPRVVQMQCTATAIHLRSHVFLYVAGLRPDQAVATCGTAPGSLDPRFSRRSGVQTLNETSIVYLFRKLAVTKWQLPDVDRRSRSRTRLVGSILSYFPGSGVFWRIDWVCLCKYFPWKVHALGNRCHRTEKQYKTICLSLRTINKCVYKQHKQVYLLKSQHSVVRGWFKMDSSLTRVLYAACLILALHCSSAQGKPAWLLQAMKLLDTDPMAY